MFTARALTVAVVGVVAVVVLVDRSVLRAETTLAPDLAKPGTAPATRPIGYEPAPDFVAFNPEYRQLKRKYRDRMEALRDRFRESEAGGREMNCSRQVLLEARWLLHYTADFPRLERRLADLRAMLDAPKDPHRPGQQSPADGSLGCCAEPWFYKLIHTDDELILRELTFRTLPKRLSLLDRVNDPKKLTEYLDSLLVSDVRRTGIDHRAELSHSASILTRFLMWEIPSNYEYHPGLKPALLAYLDEKWQDPDTGYWGAWYRAADGSVVRTSDLSTTFHIVHYREGDVKRWPQILATTLAMKDDEYPYGWLEDGVMSNHHNYDVALILRLGWKHATETQRKQAAAEVRRMLDYCLTETLNDDGSFKVTPADNSIGGAYLFGVSFLLEIGYFNASHRFWTDQPFPEANERRKRILARMAAVKSSDPEIRLARLMLGASTFAK
jgi:hypothetical protein